MATMEENTYTNQLPQADPHAFPPERCRRNGGRPPVVLLAYNNSFTTTPHSTVRMRTAPQSTLHKHVHTRSTVGFHCTVVQFPHAFAVKSQSFCHSPKTLCCYKRC